METVEIFDFNSEDFSSVYLLKDIFCREDHLNTFSQLESIQLEPRLYVLRHPEAADKVCSIKPGMYVGTHGQDILKSCDLTKLLKGPYAIVILLNPNGTHRNCRLSENDVNLLQDVPAKILDNMENITFAVIGNRHHRSYDYLDVESLSYKVAQRLGMFDKRNSCFQNTYLADDDGLKIRIGLCMKNNMIDHLREIYDVQTHIVDQLDFSYRKQPLINDCLRKVVKLMHSCQPFQLPIINRERINDFSKLLMQELEKAGLLKIKKLNEQTNFIHEVLKKIIEIHGKKSIVNQFDFHSISSSISLNIENKDESRRRAICPLRDSIARRNSFSKIKNIENLLTTNIEHITENINQTLISYFHEMRQNATATLALLSEEIKNSDEKFKLHQLKTVALRHHQVKGFGCTEDQIKVYLRRNDKKDKEEVTTYLERHFDTKGKQIAGKYEINIEFQERKFVLFSSLEQGCKINKYKSPEESPSKAMKFETVGMFLYDDQDKYFFTTCAHVIGESAYAYSALDNTKLGKNVLVFDSAVDSTSPFIDFSLIQISPEKQVQCKLGLKSITGEYKDFQVFRGDLIEILNRNMYIWGATDPNKRTGKCIECHEDSGQIILRVDTKEFAKPGDSGAVVCIGDRVENCLAVFVLVGGNGDEYLVYKVSDAVDKMAEQRSNMKIHICPKVIPFGVISEDFTFGERKRLRESDCDKRSSKKMYRGKSK